MAAGFVRHGTLAGRRDADFRGCVERPDARRERHALSPKHGWFSRGPHRRGAAAARCRRTGSGCSAQLGGNLILLPTGAGAMVTLPKGDVVRFGRGAWLRDSKRIVFTGDPGDGKPRGYIQEIPAGLPRAITPVGVVSRWQSGRARRQLHPRSRRRHVDALSDSRRRCSACSGAQAWRYPASMEPRRPIRVYGRQRRGSQAASRRCLSRGALAPAAGFLWKTLSSVDIRWSRDMRDVDHPGRTVVLFFYMRRSATVRGRAGTR